MEIKMGDGGFRQQNLKTEEGKCRKLCGKRAAFLNLGCKVNAYETQAMRECFLQAGAQIVEFEDWADIYVVNTCTVTNIADRKSRQMLHRAKKKNPDGIVVAVGCYVQAAEQELQNDLSADVLVGNNKKSEIADLVAQYIEENRGEEQKSLIVRIASEKNYEEMEITTAENTRAYLKVQDGCNQFCTYCIIPYARGRIRSRNIEAVEAEVRRLAAAGYQEIVLTGIHLSSYGMEDYSERERFALRPANGDVPLVNLIRCIDRVPGIERIRLGSLEPRIVTEPFAEAIAKTKICPHFHLSLQSGCNETLERMNRRYRTEEYLESCKILRRFYDRPAITTDVIVGFPGESEEEFGKTMQFVEKVQFAQMHIFKYSRRRGTKAADMPGQVSEQVKAARSEALFALEEKMRRAYEQSFFKEETTVLFEESVQLEGKSFMIGHNERYIKFAMQTEQDLSNLFVKGQIKGDYAGEILLFERKQSKED